MAEGKKNSKQSGVIRCLNWCWNHRLAVTGVVAAVVAMWFWRFWIHNYELEIGWHVECWYKKFVEGDLWLNILLFVYTIYIAIILGYYTCLYKQRWYHLCIYGIAIATIWTVPAFEPVATPIPCLMYHVWATIVIGIVSVTEIGFMIYDAVREPEMVKKGQGFIDHITYEQHQQTGWGNYVDTMLNMISAAQLQDESFTIGITGSWGSGKTTFYNIIKKRLKKDDNFGICEFQPWQVVNYTQLSTQFFVTFKQYLINQGVLPESDLISDISKYAGVLESIPEVSSFAKPFINAIQTHEDSSLQSMHDKIGQVLSEQKILTAVMIDDLDRLNKNELMEVLRLIRVSANFRNVLFVVTYDKGHIANIIGENGTEYLKKIVNVEINLPPIENYKYMNLLLGNITRIVPGLSQNQLNELKNAFRVQDKDTKNTLLNKYSHNFRDLLRFSNHFGLVLTHLKSMNLLSEYNLFDLFWLEMLRYFDEDTYYQLQEHPLHLLNEKENRNTKQVYLQLKNINQREKKSTAILKVLFGENRTHYDNTIIWRNNYNNYFAHRLLDNAVSMTEFTTLMGGCISSAYLYNQIKRWSMGHQRKSLEQVVNNYPHSNVFQSGLAVKNYLRVLFELNRLNVFNEESLKELFRAKSRSSFYHGLNADQLKMILRRVICQHPGIEWNHLLSSMCVEWTQEMEEWDDYSRFEDEFVLKQHELTELAKSNYQATFGGQIMPLSELFNSDSKHFQFISTLSYVAKVYTDAHNNNTKQYSNLIGNYIVDEFEQHYTYKAGTKEFKYIYDNLIQYSGVQGMEDDSVAISLIQETIEQNLGSLSNFEKIVNRYFKLNSIYTKRCRDIGIKIK